MALTVGDRLGHYVVTALIGEGGMGQVYRATDTKLHRTVALKVLNQSDPDAHTRLLHEARASSALNHPHICAVYEVGEHDGRPFIVMEHVDGEPLSEVIPADGLPTETVIRYGMQVADALAHAHALGIVHRDLKSLNVVVTPEGRAKVLDFGIATRVAGSELETVTHSEAALRETGHIVGTLAYMAPEVLRGETADSRSDIWALGVLLFEMAMGRRPFIGASGAELTSAIMRDPPPPLPARIPRSIRVVAERCVAKEPGQRYQHISEVRAALETVETVGRPGAGRGEPGPQLSRRALLMAGGVAVVFALLIGTRFLRDSQRMPPGSGQIPISSLAVLPLGNLMNDPEQAYFVDGMTEALIAELAQVGDLKVISRTSVTRYAGSDQPLPQIARELGVDAVVEGSVLRAGDEVRITAQLIHGATDEHIWAGTYERELADILRLQREVAGAIAVEIHGTLTRAGAARLSDAPAVNPGAHEEYLWGRYYWNRRSEANLYLAQEHFQKAIEADPDYAEAYAGLADTFTMLGVYGSLSGREGGDLAQAAALRALELDPESAQGHTALGYSLFSFEWDWAAAGQALRRGVELNPNDSAARNWYATFLMATGRTEEATVQMAAAKELDPLSPVINVGVALVDMFARRYDQAVEVARDLLSKIPDFGPARLTLARVYVLQNRLDEAAAEFERLATQVESTENQAELAGVYAMLGRRAEALDILQRLEEPAPSGMPAVALAWFRLGDSGETLRWLTRAREERSVMMVTLGSPYFDSLRDDPRLQDLIRGMRFPQDQTRPR